MKRNSRNKNRRAQVSKPAKSANRDMMEGFQELRKGNRAQPHTLATDYRRKPKHAGRGWEQ